VSAPEPSRCRSCGAAVLWLRHHRTGRLAPIDAEPADNGIAILVGDDRYAIVVQATPAPITRYAPHYATCPQAATWRGANPSSG